MLSRVGSAKRFAVLSVVAVLLKEKAHVAEEVFITPLVRDAGPQFGTWVQRLAELEPWGRQDRVYDRRLRGGQADGLGRPEALDHQGFHSRRYGVGLGRYPDDTRRGPALRD